MRTWSVRLGALVCLLLVLSVPAAAKRLVRVGYYPMANFQEYNVTEKTYRGYSYEYMMALAQYADWEYQFVPVAYEDGLRRLMAGELDLMNAVEKQEDRLAVLDFTSVASGEGSILFVTSPENRTLSYEDFASFSGLRVGMTRSNVHNADFFHYAAVNGFQPEVVYFDTQEEVLTALHEGRIDACPASRLQDLSVRVIGRFRADPYYFATPRSEPELTRELQAAINALNTNDPYFEPMLFAKYYGRNAEQSVVLSAAEQAYVAAEPVVRVTYDPAWYPLSYRDEKGHFAGAVARLYEKLADRTGLRFEFVASDTYMDALGAFSRGEVQMMANLAYDYTWAAKQHGRLTPAFTSVTLVEAFLPGHEAHRTVALPAGYYQQYLSQVVRRDGYVFKNYASIEDCLDAVIRGEADCTFLNSYQLEYYRGRWAYRGMAFKVLPGMEYQLALAVSEAADPRLYSIVSKAMRSMSSEEVGTIFQDAQLAASSRSLLDVMYANPALFAVLAFVLAIVLTALAYSQLLRRKNQQLQAATAAKEAFFSNISHEMRTPLNGVLGFTDLALKASSAATMRSYLQRIKVSSEFLLSLINDVLDISKMEKRKVHLRPEVVVLAEALESVRTVIQPLAAAKRLQFSVPVDAQAPEAVLADRLRLQQIFLNLLSNAVKFTPEGGEVSFAVQRLEPMQQGANLLFTVQDSGRGISPDFLPHIYEAFSQEGRMASGGAVGTGLGLAIVRQLVALMGGRIEAVSQLGKGTCFRVYLFLQPCPRPAAAPREEAAVQYPHLAGQVVLLCEDNAINVELATLLLQEQQMAVVTAANGQEGVARFAASPVGYFAAILMDIRMPVMNGIEATQAIRALPRPDARTVPILAMTADADADDADRSLSAGMDAHLAKPIEPAKLFAALERFCQ